MTYAVYHFGTLGIMAYYTRSILGGIMVYVDVAWLMDLFAFLQKA